jgi:hypothetical protein
MPFIKATITGPQDVIVQLDRLPDSLNKELVGTITGLTTRLFNAVRAPGHFGAYKRMEVASKPDLVQGKVFFNASGSQAAAIAALEYGAPGKSGRSRPPVTEHKRMQTQVFGRAIAPMEVIVDRYRRKARLTERRFLRGPLAAIRDDAEREIREAVERAAAKSTGP